MVTVLPIVFALRLSLWGAHQNEVVLGSSQGHIQALRIAHKAARSRDSSGQNNNWLLQALQCQIALLPCS